MHMLRCQIYQIIKNVLEEWILNIVFFLNLHVIDLYEELMVLIIKNMISTIAT